MALKEIKTISQAFFTNASDGTDTNVVATVSIDTANIYIKTTTTDTNVMVSTNETVVQSEGDAGPSVVFLTTIASTDTTIKVETDYVISSDKVILSTSGTEFTTEVGLVTQIETKVSTPTVLDYYLYTQTKNSDLTDLPPEPEYKYFICKHNLVQPYIGGNTSGDVNLTCIEMYSLMNVICCKMSLPLWNSLRPLWYGEKIIELDKETAYWGTTLFSEIRPVAKVWEARATFYGEKIPTEVTPLMKDRILTVMKSFAYNLIEDEFDRRYLAMRDASDLEAASWEIQKAEAKEWLEMQGQNGSITPFLDYLAAERNVDKTELSNKILQKAQEYQDQLSILITNMQILIKKFEKTISVWDMNILYEDYFGVGMPVKQAIELGRVVSETDWTRKPEWEIKGNGYYF